MSVVCRNCMPLPRVVRLLSSRCCVLRPSLPHTRLQMPSVLQSVRQCSVGSEAMLATPSSDGETKVYPQKIQQVVDQIATLTLLEVADLNELLKNAGKPVDQPIKDHEAPVVPVLKTLNIQDAPVMATGMPMAATPLQDQEEEEEETPVQAVQTSFSVKLTTFDSASKVKLIKQIKSISTDMNLVQAKNFVESVPAVVKADIGKDEAEKLKEQIEAVGGTCEIE